MTENVRRPSTGALSDINITPLIDVMLVLLIIFMIVTPVASKSIETSLPRDPSEVAPPPPPQHEALVLEVSAEGLRLNRSALTGLDELGERLRDVLLARSDKTVFVRAEGTLRYAQVMSVLDVAKGAGADRIGIIGTRAEGASSTSR